MVAALYFHMHQTCLIPPDHRYLLLVKKIGLRSICSYLPLIYCSVLTPRRYNCYLYESIACKGSIYNPQKPSNLKLNGFSETLQVESRSPGLADRFEFIRQLTAFPQQGHDHTLLHSPGGLPVWRGPIKACGPGVEPSGC